MSKLSAQELVDKFAAAVVYVAVELPNGDQSVGSAFHVGDGVFITARHVVDGCRILEVANTFGRQPKIGKLIGGPFFHPDPSVDVAAILIQGLECPIIQLGGHLDDWIVDDQFLLNEVVILGFPPIPFARSPVLVASRAEVSAVVDKYTGGHPHFVISAMARGGFSGGPCLTGDGWALGLVTESLVDSSKAVELGYLAVLTVEPIHICLSHHGIIPSTQDIKFGGDHSSVSTDPSDEPF
ncbi:S1-C subfamily serine protease [Pelomonas saccharophila]|uniref:S1-C subfamily serine protease n=1 Tax=Roseateles saccharophilus TaxID=304 RepID=A0ABU1YW80_ROSSA|nr:serine protease [Roseateles saccharophilus]MDR7273134.1 S1-C subfamily serine protease [Roseateles saccharophilus]